VFGWINSLRIRREMSMASFCGPAANPQRRLLRGEKRCQSVGNAALSSNGQVNKSAVCGKHRVSQGTSASRNNPRVKRPIRRQRGSICFREEPQRLHADRPLWAMGQSDLHGDMQRQAEMTCPLAQAESNKMFTSWDNVNAMG
jgi:hypothetical protein